jgi:hypothetical protein
MHSNCGRGTAGGAQQTRRRRVALLLLFAGLVQAAGAELPACSGDASWSVWLRRAMAPSSQSGAKRAVPTSVACATWEKSSAASAARNSRKAQLASAHGDEGCEMQGSGKAELTTGENGGVQRAFVPSASPDDGVRVSMVRCLGSAQRKLSRVTVDKAAGEDEIRCFSQPAPAKRQFLAMRGGGVEHAFDRSSSMDKARVLGGSGDSKKGGEKVRARWRRSAGHRRGLAFMHGDSSIIGSPGCSRDWSQLVKSTALTHFDSAREAACGRSSGHLVRYSVRSRSPSRDRPYRLSRTVEDAELPTAYRPAFSH